MNSSAKLRILLVDDEADSLLPTLVQHMSSLGFTFLKESLAEHALERIGDSQADAVLLDLHFPGDERREDGRTTGGTLLTRIRQQFNDLAVVVFTTRLDDADIPLEEFVEQPHGRFAKPDFSVDRNWAQALDRALRQAIQAAKLARSAAPHDLGFVVGHTKEMQEVVKQVRIAAQNALGVLIYGETGTGKQGVAEAIHRLSGRNGRFEQISCSAIHEETLEARLFGHERGAFTGATVSRPGLFEIADGGTVFLDEIQRMPRVLQEKLKKVIEDGRVQRMGQTTADRQVDVRLIVATNHSLSDLVADELLMDDLAHRFAVLLISLPSLRQHLGDLPELFSVFIERANAQTGKDVKKALRPETLEKLRSHSWPGNIRELEHTIVRAVAQTTSNVLMPEDITFVDLEPKQAGRSKNTSPPHAEIAPEEANTAYGPPSTADEKSSRAATLDLGVGHEKQAVLALADKLESLPVDSRYVFLLNQTDGTLRCQVLAEFVRRLRVRTGRKVRHKQLAAELDSLANGQRDLERIRQFVNTCWKLTELECNQ